MPKQLVVSLKLWDILIVAYQARWMKVEMPHVKILKRKFIMGQNIGQIIA